MVEYNKEVLPKLSSSNQFAYPANVGTTDAIIHAIEKWSELLDKRPKAELEVIVKGVSKAFDKCSLAN